MLQFQQHLFRAFFFFTNDVINHSFPINSQYLKTWGVDSPAFTLWNFSQKIHLKASPAIFWSLSKTYQKAIYMYRLCFLEPFYSRYKISVSEVQASAESKTLR